MRLMRVHISRSPTYLFSWSYWNALLLVNWWSICRWLTSFHLYRNWRIASSVAGSRVVKSLDCGARGPGFESRCRRKCWAVMELFVNIYLYQFALCLVCERVRCFGLYWLSYGIEMKLAPCSTLCIAATLQMLVVALVHSWLDYRNGVLVGFRLTWCVDFSWFWTL